MVLMLNQIRQQPATNPFRPTGIPYRSAPMPEALALGVPCGDQATSEAVDVHAQSSVQELGFGGPARIKFFE